jgi:hypothetical protein
MEAKIFNFGGIQGCFPSFAKMCEFIAPFPGKKHAGFSVCELLIVL